MKNNKIKEIYQKELRFIWIKENLKPSLKGLMYFALVAAVPILFSLSSIVDSTEEVVGTVTGIAAFESEEGNRVYMMATLEGDSNVRVYILGNVPIRKGRKAVLIAKKGGSSEVIRDSFKEYADD